mmetsp:Transcript_17368/g.41690  ORF Transcript_17368/g.41690 Transcript_17368/m.41690 type:complete len:587 (+) Transcript_17368:954-2714(+)
MTLHGRGGRWGFPVFSKVRMGLGIDPDLFGLFLPVIVLVIVMAGSAIPCQELRLKLSGVKIREEVVTKDGFACHTARTMFLVLLLDAKVILPPSVETTLRLPVAPVLLPVPGHPRLELVPQRAQRAVAMLPLLSAMPRFRQGRGRTARQHRGTPRRRLQLPSPPLEFGQRAMPSLPLLRVREPDVHGLVAVAVWGASERRRDHFDLRGGASERWRDHFRPGGVRVGRGEPDQYGPVLFRMDDDRGEGGLFLRGAPRGLPMRCIHLVQWLLRQWHFHLGITRYFHGLRRLSNSLLLPVLINFHVRPPPPAPRRVRFRPLSIPPVLLRPPHLLQHGWTAPRLAHTFEHAVLILHRGPRLARVRRVPHRHHRPRAEQRGECDGQEAKARERAPPTTPSPRPAREGIVRPDAAREGEGARRRGRRGRQQVRERARDPRRGRSDGGSAAREGGGGAAEGRALPARDVPLGEAGLRKRREGRREFLRGPVDRGIERAPVVGPPAPAGISGGRREFDRLLHLQFAPRTVSPIVGTVRIEARERRVLPPPPARRRRRGTPLRPKPMLLLFAPPRRHGSHLHGHRGGEQRLRRIV